MTTERAPLYNGLDWMYENPAMAQKAAESEEYLLGTKAALPGVTGNEGPTGGFGVTKQLEEKSAPGSLFLTSLTTTSEDTLRKLREDPMFIIRQAEQKQKQAAAKAALNPLRGVPPPSSRGPSEFRRSQSNVSAWSTAGDRRMAGVPPHATPSEFRRSHSNVSGVSGWSTAGDRRFLPERKRKSGGRGGRSSSEESEREEERRRKERREGSKRRGDRGCDGGDREEERRRRERGEGSRRRDERDSDGGNREEERKRKERREGSRRRDEREKEGGDREDERRKERKEGEGRRRDKDVKEEYKEESREEESKIRHLQAPTVKEENMEGKVNDLGPPPAFLSGAGGGGRPRRPRADLSAEEKQRRLDEMKMDGQRHESEKSARIASAEELERKKKILEEQWREKEDKSFLTSLNKNAYMESSLTMQERIQRRASRRMRNVTDDFCDKR